MTDTEIALILAELTSTWRVRFNEANAQAWGAHFIRRDFEPTLAAIRHLAESSPNLPSIAEIVATTNQTQRYTQTQELPPPRNEDLNAWGWRTAQDIRRNVTTERKMLGRSLTDIEVHNIVTETRRQSPHASTGPDF